MAGRLDGGAEDGADVMSGADVLPPVEGPSLYVVVVLAPSLEQAPSAMAVATTSTARRLVPTGA
ncbi:MAG TPA: hypothetical protein PK020_11545 [Ilumatobacteraceae bacterium]|nr:hypothetical protein [Ilumatobacteraceae bacterium]